MALKVWRHYLYSAKFEIFTDYKSLKYVFTQRDLNLRQRRWVEYMKDYDFELAYHPDKANMVANALSKKSYVANLLASREWRLMIDMADAVYRVPRQQGTTFVASLSVMPRVYTRVVAAQQEDQQIQRVLRLPEVSYGEDDTVRFRNRLYVPSAARQELCDEAHRSKLSIHPGRNKMYQNVKRHFWWPGMKREIVEYVSRCLTCQ